MYTASFILNVTSRAQQLYDLLLVRSGLGVVSLRSSISESYDVVVDFEFYISWYIWPSDVDMHGVKKQRSFVELGPGHARKFLLLIVRINVLGLRLKYKPCRYWMSSVFPRTL